MPLNGVLWAEGRPEGENDSESWVSLYFKHLTSIFAPQDTKGTKSCLATPMPDGWVGGFPLL